MRFNRLINLIGTEKFSRLANRKIAVLGLGGVGSFAAESLVRSGIKELLVVDYDLVDITNVNRQLIALNSTLNQEKVAVFKSRALDINPEINIETISQKITSDNIHSILDRNIDYVLDCVDDLDAKLEIAKFCLENKINFISAMGFANKMHPELIKIARLNQTKVCPLAKAYRRKVKLAGYPLIVDVVYSEEIPVKPLDSNILGSNAVCPSTAGLLMSSHVINKILGE